MLNFKRRLVFISFFTNFVFRLGIFLVAGIVLCILGVRYRMCLALGVAFIAFDLIVSILETVKMFRTINAGGHPAIEDLKEALNSYDSDEAMRKYAEEIENNPEAMSARVGRYFLQERLKEGCSAEDIVSAYEELCKDEDEPNLTYDCLIQGNDLCFYMTKDYIKEDGEFFQLRTVLKFDIPQKKTFECLLSDKDKKAFLDGVRNSKGYKYAMENKGRDLEIYIEET
ncbi:MAG: hypothetical protein IJ869_03910 [Clostridiales bacterium]|nr:hypothetical protein [Clostridiales bacterium]HAW15962.1 hypothetical protein [Clostridiales bacterium]